MPVPSTIDDLSTTASSNSPAGTDSPQDGDNYIRALSSFVAQLRDKLDGSSGSVTLEAPTINDPAITGTATAEVLSVSGMLTAEDLTVSSTATVTALNVLGDLTVGDELTVNGVATFGGDINLGNATSDTVTLSGTLAGLWGPGTYSPTATAIANCSAVSALDSIYIRLGNHILCYGYVYFTVTSTSAITQIGISLPVASNFTVTTDAFGKCAGPFQTGNHSAIIYADGTNDRVVIDFTSSGTGAHSMQYDFMYKVK